MTVLLGLFPPVAVILFPHSGEIATCSDWLMPQLVSCAIHAFLTVRLFASAVAVTEKCHRAVAFVNSLQGSLPSYARPEHWLLVTHMASTDAGIFIGGIKMTMSQRGDWGGGGGGGGGGRNRKPPLQLSPHVKPSASRSYEPHTSTRTAPPPPPQNCAPGELQSRAMSVMLMMALRLQTLPGARFLVFGA